MQLNFGPGLDYENTGILRRHRHITVDAVPYCFLIEFHSEFHKNLWSKNSQVPNDSKTCASFGIFWNIKVMIFNFLTGNACWVV